jgi:pimeloyl-ACP methyl ester carboxylesterase
MTELKHVEKKMKQQSPFRIKRIPAALSVKLLMAALLLVTSCTRQAQQSRTEEIVFHSGSFKVVGDLRFPEGEGPHPVVVFVHGDGPNNRTSGVTYPPIMNRMGQAGYATFAWDKPGTGESTGQIDRSRLGEQRARIVLDAIEVLKARSDIDPGQIGLWGISQAGYVMPRVLSKSEDIAFMIAISCPGTPGVDQGAYLVSAQAVCAGIPEEAAEQMKLLLSAIEMVQTYNEYVEYKKRLDALPGIESAAIFGYKKGVKPEDEWHAGNPEGEYFWNPIEVIEKTTIPVLAVFGEMDTQADPFQGAQAYRDALSRAGNTNFRVELIPGTDHNIILSKTGCLDERENRSRMEWTNYAPRYLDILEDWLKELHRRRG